MDSPCREIGLTSQSSKAWIKDEGHKPVHGGWLNQQRYLLKKEAMVITEQMLQAGVNKAIELGVLPRQSCPEDLATNTEIMQEILQAALSSPPPVVSPAPTIHSDNGALSQ